MAAAEGQEDVDRLEDPGEIEGCINRRMAFRLLDWEVQEVLVCTNKNLFGFIRFAPLMCICRVCTPELAGWVVALDRRYELGPGECLPQHMVVCQSFWYPWT